MDHREQMQKEAEQWQPTGRKIVQSVRYGVVALAVLGLLILFVQNLGFPQEVNETHSAMVIPEDGQPLYCTVEIRGEVTNYLLNPNKFGMDDQVTIYINGNRILLMSYNGDSSTGTLCAQNQNAVCVMTVRRNALVLETDLRNIFPDMDSQRCLVSIGYDSFKIPGEYAELFTFLK